MQVRRSTALESSSAKVTSAALTWASVAASSLTGRRAAGARVARSSSAMSNAGPSTSKKSRRRICSSVGSWVTQPSASSTSGVEAPSRCTMRALASGAGLPARMAR